MDSTYLDKENYITVQPDPNIWRNHANYKIMESYKEYIKGISSDFGANHGACTLLLLDFNPEVIYGYDINIKALEIAYTTAQSLNTKVPVNFVVADLRSIPNEDNFFDFGMSFHTLEHIYPEDSKKVVGEFYRVLKPDGYFVISIPYDHEYPDPYHVAFYKEDTLSELFESQGFKTIECFKDDRFVEKGLLTGLFKK